MAGEEGVAVVAEAAATQKPVASTTRRHHRHRTRLAKDFRQPKPLPLLRL